MKLRILHKGSLIMLTDSGAVCVLWLWLPPSCSVVSVEVAMEQYCGHQPCQEATLHVDCFY